MFGMGRHSLFPMADIGLQNALKKHFDLAQKPSKAEMEQYIKEWEPYLSYASLYLWRSIESGVNDNHAKRPNCEIRTKSNLSINH